MFNYYYNYIKTGAKGEAMDNLNQIKTGFRVISFVLDKKDELMRIWKTQFQYRNEDVRLSIAYVYRIKVDNKYLLVKSQRIKDQYQPVGGVYKIYPTASRVMEELNVKTDHGYNPNSKGLEDDLRIKLQGKNVLKLMKWFNTQKDREYTPYREFYEELIETGILDSKNFAVIRPRFIKRIIGKMEKSKKFGCQEILIKDICTVEFTHEQIEELRKTMVVQDNRYKWFTTKEIERGGKREDDENEDRIGEHTIDIL